MGKYLGQSNLGLELNPDSELGGVSPGSAQKTICCADDQTWVSHKQGLHDSLLYLCLHP